MEKSRVAIALSGGVDSSVAAFLLKQQGYDVIGLHMLLWTPHNQGAMAASDQSNIDDIQQFCLELKIPLYIIDLRSEFERNVIDYFCQQYAGGYTPNPCIVCNRYIKFGAMWQRAVSLGSSYIATGHYAVINFIRGKYHLFKGVDSTKDQSYMLYRLDQDQLSRIIFPIGKYQKKEVIDLARREKFRAANKKSSQDICFNRGSKYTDYLLKYVHPVPGEIVDKSGNVLGKHRGIIYYTIGQRCGLGIASDRPLYVSDINGTNHRITVTAEEAIYSTELLARDVHWISGKPPRNRTGIKAKIRYKSEEAGASITIEGEHIRVKFKKLQRSISPGQSVVFYSDNEILGGGIIEK